MRALNLKIYAVVMMVFWGAGEVSAVPAEWPAKTYYRQQEVDGQKIFYREAGEKNKPTILLLHGYPSSSHTYRELIPLLSGRYHVIAPDNLGSGYSDKPDPETTDYSFDLLADFLEGLIKALDIKKYAIYMQDFGAPVGYRLMMRDPSKVTAIIVQNANAYLEGIPEAKQAFFRKAQTDKSPENVANLYAFTGAEAVKHKQYLRDVPGKEEIMSPDAWTHDSHFLESEKERKIQVELFQDYKSNLDAYPLWQDFLRKHQFPALLVWGRNDPVFTAAGAEAYLKDLPNAKLHLLDAGHFAVEEKAIEIAKHIIRLMAEVRVPKAESPHRIKAVAFDAFPVFDPRPVFEIIKEEFPERGDELRKLWFQKIFSYTWLRTSGRDEYKDFWNVTEDALNYSAASMHLELSAEAQKRIMQAFLELPVWPDAVSTLKQLKEKNIQIAFLSNMTEEMLRANLRHNRIEELFDFVISTDSALAFKPSPQAYQLAVETFGFEKEEIVFVAFAGWDAAGAQWFGFPTVWVNRFNSPAEELDAKSDYEGSSLTALIDFIQNRAVR